MKKAFVKYGIIAGVALILSAAIFLVLFLNRQVVCPDVKNKTESEATAILTDAGFSVTVDREFSDVFLKDRVISQSINGSEKAKHGSEILIVVSKGVEQIALPNLKNLTADEAKSTLEDLGFNVSVLEEFSNSIDKGKVISQSVSSGSSAPKGAYIDITVSKGPDLVTVPDVTGLSAEEAEAKLLHAGLTIKTEIKCSSSVKEGKIISQDLAANSQASRNAPVVVKISAGKANKKGTTPGNSNNFGHVTSQGNWTYYACRDGLYRTHKNNGNTELISNRSPVGLNVVAEWAYFCDGTVGGIYKTRIDGTNETKLSDITSYCLYVEEDWIYYTDQYCGGILYKMKTDGSSATKLTDENCREYIVLQNTIYYVSSGDGLVYKISTSGGDKTILKAGFRGGHLALVGDRLVLSGNSDSILSVKLDGSGYTSYSIGNIQRSYFNGNDGWLYYLEHDFTKEGYPSAYCRIKPDGSQRTVILEIDFLNHANSFVNVLDGWLYFQNEHQNDDLYRVRINGKDLERVG